VAGARVAVWGLAFKPQTDDLREAPALVLIDALLAAGATVVVHDPVAMPHARARLGARVAFAESNYDALEGADALVIVTDWNEYRHPNFERMLAALAQPVVVDGRNLYDPARMAALGFRYHSIGRGSTAESVVARDTERLVGREVDGGRSDARDADGGRSGAREVDANRGGAAGEEAIACAS
jgi:UDPglucose 6-dehydrogenase